MSDNSSAKSGGITFMGALQVLFIGLKLGGVIDWPWHLVLMPIIAEIAVFILALLIIIGSAMW